MKGKSLRMVVGPIRVSERVRSEKQFRRSTLPTSRQALSLQQPGRCASELGCRCQGRHPFCGSTYSGLLCSVQEARTDFRLTQRLLIVSFINLQACQDFDLSFAKVTREYLRGGGAVSERMRGNEDDVRQVT